MWKKINLINIKVIGRQTLFSVEFSVTLFLASKKLSKHRFTRTDF